MKKQHYLFIVLSFFMLNLSAQDSFYSTNKETFVGAKLIDGGDLLNSKICQVKKGQEVLKFTPDEVVEYGFEDGRIYISKMVNVEGYSQKVFLERLVKGNTTLYYYRGRKVKTFFLEKGENFFEELVKHKTENSNFHEDLLTISKDCENVADAAKLVRYGKEPLTEFISRYNKCGDKKPFPFLKYGVLGGFGTTKLVSLSPIASGYLNQFDYTFETGFTVGVFIDNPISVSNFSWHTELFFSQNQFDYTAETDNSQLTFYSQTTTLNLPFMIRYTHPLAKIRPFVNIGLYYAYHLDNKNPIYETTTDFGVEHTEEVFDTSSISNHQTGALFGLGAEIKLNYRRNLFVELRSNYLYSLFTSQGKTRTLNSYGAHVFIGMNF